MTYTIPTININGSDPAELLKGYFKAHKAASDLLEAMAQIRPHGRDYQGAPEHHFGMAREEFAEQEQAIVAVRKYLYDVGLAISAQTP